MQREPTTPRAAALRGLPAVDEVLARPRVAGLVPALARCGGRAALAELVRELLAERRATVAGGTLEPEALARELARGGLEEELERRVRRAAGAGLVPALNATGVVLHTGLGRAPVHPEVAAAMAAAAGAYCVLEVDRASGRRSRRDDRLSELVARLSGAEAALAVNNNAAAVLLALNTFGAGREVIVSRGELVEIGGSFRIPDVMQRAGATLREVGTTNRTRAEDYRRAAGERTGLLMKVHTSNFRVEGFTQEVSAAELASLGRELGVPTAFDLGSGLLEAPGAEPLPELGGEPRVREAVESGVDLVLFSGDKLLGGPQAGLAAGRRAAVEALRANPTYRALRLDKVGLAGLERTLELYLEGRGDELPARSMMARPAEELRRAAERIAQGLAGLAGLEARVVAEGSPPGSGSAPGVLLATSAVALRPACGAEELARRLRAGEPPVFARIHEGELRLDPRTLLPGDEERLVAAVRAAAGGA